MVEYADRAGVPRNDLHQNDYFVNGLFNWLKGREKRVHRLLYGMACTIGTAVLWLLT